MTNVSHGATVGVCNGDYCDYWQEHEFTPTLSMDGKFFTCNTTHYGWDNNGIGVNMVETTSAYFGITVTGTSEPNHNHPKYCKETLSLVMTAML